MKLAIYGYDTIVGKLILELLEESTLNIEELYPLSPIAAEYDAVPFRGKNHIISYVDEFDFSKADVALFLTTKDESKRLIPEVQDTGCIVVDNSHLYSGDENVPIILKDINPYIIDKDHSKKVVGVPYATTSEIALSLAPFHDEYGISSAVVTALVAVSEHGELGTQTLARETSQLLNGMGVDVTDFPAQLAFNIHTRIGKENEEGVSEHEEIVKKEVFALLDKFEDELSLTCLQVPTFYGHTLSVNVKLQEDATLEDIKALIRDSSVLMLEEDVEVEIEDEDDEPLRAANEDHEPTARAVGEDEISNESDKDEEDDANELVDRVEMGGLYEDDEAKKHAPEIKVKRVKGETLVSPVSCADLDNKIFISRLRKTARATFDFTVVMDNTRYGEAASALGILQILAKRF